MPWDKTKSPLVKKYGEKRVLRARNMIARRLGIDVNNESAMKKFPWSLVGHIAQSEQKAGKTIKKKDVAQAKKTYAKKGKPRWAKTWKKKKS